MGLSGKATAWARRRIRRLALGASRVGTGVSGPAADSFSPARLRRSFNRPGLRRPALLRADALAFPGDELILGLDVEGEARAYPTCILRRHDVVNDVLGGARVLVCFCLHCLSGAAFDPTVEDRVLTFDVFGGYEGAMVMRDAETGTIWSHLTGDALSGPMVPRRLAMLPVHMTTLERWLAVFPDSTAPDPASLSVGERVPPDGRAVTRAWARTVSRWDHRLPPQTMILGVEAEDRARAYVLDPRKPGPRLHQDELGDTPIALLGWPGAWPVAYDRRTDRGVIELRLEGERVLGDLGSTWTPEGRATDGPRAGTRLSFLPSHVVQWYAWSSYRPGTDIVDLRSAGAR